MFSIYDSLYFLEIIHKRDNNDNRKKSNNNDENDNDNNNNSKNNSDKNYSLSKSLFAVENFLLKIDLQFLIFSSIS